MKPTESQLEHLMIMTREYFDNIPSRYRSVPQWEEASKDVIGLLSNLSKLLKSDKLDELAKEMENDLDFESTTDPNEDRENDVEWNNRPNQIYKG
jgi:hypothetical protein